MAAIGVTPSLVRPLHGAVIRRFRTGAALAVGDVVYIATDGDIEPADADAQLSACGRGIVVAVEVDGAVSASAGKMVDVVTHGPVELGPTSAMTIGSVIYTSPDAGKLDQTAPGSGDYPFIVGWAMTGTAMYVDPQSTLPTVVGG